MNDYIMLILDQQTDPKDVPPAAIAKIIAGHKVFAQNLRDAGAYKDSERLRPTKEAKRVMQRDGRAVIQDGPFPETKESVGGYYLYQAASLEAAKAIAAKCPMTPGGSYVVHEVMSGETQPQKDTSPGKVFGFLVRGKAQVMDTIDEETQALDWGSRFLGGVRLEGPFAETKEVVGGLFFMRFAGMEEAIIWAKETPFVRHGTLEIRELWRT